VFGRLERVDKDEDLLATKEPSENGDERIVKITAFTLGYLRDFEPVRNLTTGVGGDVTFYGLPSRLEPAYGDFPISVHAFLRLRWGERHAHAAGSAH
jgi:hypothetical protein